MINVDEMKAEAKKYIRYEKDKSTRIATITIDRPETLNSMSAGMRQYYADLVFKANVDDDVKVLVIRGEGRDVGTGGDLPELLDAMTPKEGGDPSLLHEFGLDDPDVHYPPFGSFRFMHSVSDHYARAEAGNRPLQEFKKISIFEAKGYCYGWHFYQAADADLLISSEDALFGHPSFRYIGWGPRLWTWIETMGVRKFSEMLFTGRPFTAKEMAECNFINSIVARENLEEETKKYALACSQSRPTDTVQVQKTFLEIYKQYRGEYMGSMLSGLVEGMGAAMKPDRPGEVDLFDPEVLRQGLNNVVKDVDMDYPPEWRMSRSNRKKP